MNIDPMAVIEQHESAVRSYVRSFPAVFTKASGAWLEDTEGNRYLDFFAGASVLNYGHNNPVLKQALIEYIAADGITHSLDMASTARASFLETFHRLILKPRNLDYKVQFPGPAGNNAVEAALKIARKVKGREKIMSFTNAFHGMTLGALSITGNAFKRQGAGLPLTHSDSMPYCDYFGPEQNTTEYIDRMLEDSGSGMDLPAAAVVETVQAEGGVKVANDDWLRDLAAICTKYDILLIVDDIQTGNGRCGSFFSFEAAGIVPDVVTVSKSISGYGLPMALTLLRPELDIWEPGEHNGTFRGNNHAFVTATRTLETYWADDRLERDIARRTALIEQALARMVRRHPQARGCPRGRGMMQAIEFADKDFAAAVSSTAFTKGLMIETAGPDDEVLKLLPPLVISDDDLRLGLAIIDESIAEVVLARSAPQKRVVNA
jgi:diaminobutyrate-2-oxoglutarate transaminase